LDGGSIIVTIDSGGQHGPAGGADTAAGWEAAAAYLKEGRASLPQARSGGAEAANGAINCIKWCLWIVCDLPYPRTGFQ